MDALFDYTKPLEGKVLDKPFFALTDDGTLIRYTLRAMYSWTRFLPKPNLLAKALNEGDE